MTSHANLVLSGIPALIGLVCVTFGVLFLRKYATLAGSETVDVADVDPGMGPVQLVGQARAAGEPLVAPFSGTETLAYTWQIKQYKPVGSGTKGHQIGRGKDIAPFVLEDETGKILVDPAGNTDISFEEHQVLETDDERRPPESAAAILDELDREVAADSPDEFHWRRFYESRLDPGEEVLVTGPVQPGPAEGAPGDVVRPYVGASGDGETFLIADSGEEGSKQRYRRVGLRWLGAGVGLLALAAVLFVVV